MRVNMFKPETKSQVLKDISRAYGGVPRRIINRYPSVAREGYKENFVVFRCLEEIIKSSLNIDFVIKKYSDDGEDLIVKNHKLMKVLNKPNPTYSMSELKHRAMLSYYIGGQAPLQFIRTVDGGTLFTYRPDRVEYRLTGDILEQYRDVYYTAGLRTHIPDDEFIMWKRYDPLDLLDGLGIGMSSLEPILKIIDQHNAFKDWNISLLQHGGSLSGIVTFSEVLQEDEFDRMKASLKQEHGGKDKVGKYLLLDGGASFHQTSSSPKDMDWIDGENNTIVQICSGLGVDPIIIGFNDKSTYNNKQEATKELYRKTTIPRLTEFADCLSQYFVNQRLLAPGEYIGLDYSRVPELQDDLDKIVERVAKEKHLSVNEKRELRGQKPIPGGDVIVLGDGIVIKDGVVYGSAALVPLTPEKPETVQEDKSFLY